MGGQKEEEGKEKVVNYNIHRDKRAHNFFWATFERRWFSAFCAESTSAELISNTHKIENDYSKQTITVLPTKVKKFAGLTFEQD